MPAYRVELTRINRVQGCCGHPRTVQTGSLGTEVTQEHDRWCRVGRLLRGPWRQDAREIQEQDDRRQVRIA